VRVIGDAQLVIVDTQTPCRNPLGKRKGWTTPRPVLGVPPLLSR
jgi:hypothetical protein